MASSSHPLEPSVFSVHNMNMKLWSLRMYVFSIFQKTFVCLVLLCCTDFPIHTRGVRGVPVDIYDSEIRNNWNAALACFSSVVIYNVNEDITAT